MVNAGYVYILTNRSFPEYVKIGYADDVQNRLKELNRSECIPYAFRIYATYGVNERLTDKALHKMIDSLDPTLRAVDTFDGKPRKKEFYAMTPDKAYDILKTIARVSSTMNRLRKYSQDGQEILDDQAAVAVEEATTYDESSHLAHGLPSTRELYEKLKKALLEFGNVTIVPKKLYVAFKAPKNFVDVVVQRNGLKIYINLPKGDLKDPNEMAEDVSGSGHWGNGDYCVYLDDETMLDYVLGFISIP